MAGGKDLRSTVCNVRGHLILSHVGESARRAVAEKGTPWLSIQRRSYRGAGFTDAAGTKHSAVPIMLPLKFLAMSFDLDRRKFQAQAQE